MTTHQLSRYRMRTDRPGLRLRAGEIVLGIPSEPAHPGMVALVRCETDRHNPGTVLPLHELEHIELTGETLGPGSWGRPGVRP
ncbi:hypothetical protein [Kocuria sp. U4B]